MTSVQKADKRRAERARQYARNLELARSQGLLLSADHDEVSGVLGSRLKTVPQHFIDHQIVDPVSVVVGHRRAVTKNVMRFYALDFCEPNFGSIRFIAVP